MALLGCCAILGTYALLGAGLLLAWALSPALTRWRMRPRCACGARVRAPGGTCRACEHEQAARALLGHARAQRAAQARPGDIPCVCRLSRAAGRIVPVPLPGVVPCHA